MTRPLGRQARTRSVSATDAEWAPVVEAARAAGAPSVSAWVLARCTPPTRDPRVDPRAGDVVRDSVWGATEAAGFVGGDILARDGVVWPLTEWRKVFASADVLRVAP